MIDNAGQKRLMMQYLMGELSAGERAEFEDMYLEDSSVFQELVTAENELIDQYILGELSSADREKFERSFLSNPARRETVETARSLLAYSAAAEGAISPQVSESKPAKWYGRWVAQAAAAGVFLIMLSGILWLLSANRRLGNELARLEREKADQQSLERKFLKGLTTHGLLQQRDTTTPHMAELPPDIVTFHIGTGLSRGNDEMPNLILSAQAEYVALHVVLDDGVGSRYHLSIKTVEGAVVWSKDNLEPRSTNRENQEIAVTLPSHLLKNGDYVVKISTGREDLQHTLAGYSFHVVRR